MKNLKLKKILVIVFSIGIFSCLMLLIPQIRQLIIDLTEKYIMERILEDHAKWHSSLLSFSLFGCIILIFLLMSVFFLRNWQKFLVTYKIGKIINEDNTFLKWYDKQTMASKTGFYSAAIIALLTHIIMYSNLILERHLPGFSSIGGRFNDHRWFHFFANSLNFYYMNWVTGILQVIFLSFTVFLVIKSFNIKNRLYAVLIAGIFVTFPSIAESNQFFHDAAPYYFAAFLSILAYYLTNIFKLGWIPGIVLIVLSLAIYQSKISLAMMAILIHLILYTTKKNPNFISFLKYSARYLLLIFSGLIIYYLSVPFFGLGVGEHGQVGIRNISTLSEILKNVICVYPEVILYFFSSGLKIDNSLLKIAYVFLILIGIFLFIIFVKKNNGKSIIQIGITSFLIFLLPFAANFSSMFSVSGFGALAMTSYSFTFFLILPIIFLENYKINIFGLNKIMVLSLLFIIGYYISFSNFIYFRGQVLTMHSMQLANRIVGKIEPLLPYSDNNQVFITGNLIQNPIYPNTSDFHEYTPRASLYDNFGGPNDFRNPFQSLFGRIIQYRVGINLQHPPLERQQFLLDRAISNGMPVYPLEGSVAIIDGTVVAILNFFGRLDIEEINNIFLISAKHTGKATDLEFKYDWYLYRNGQRVKQIITVNTHDKIQVEVSIPGIYQIKLFIGLQEGSNIIELLSTVFEITE